MDGRYSLARYSVRPGNREVEGSLRAHDVLRADAGVAVLVPGALRSMAALRGSARGSVAEIGGVSVSSGLWFVVRMMANMQSRVIASDHLGADVRAQKNIPTAVPVEQQLSAKVSGSKDMPRTMESAEQLNAAAAGSKNIPAALWSEGVLTALSEATSQTTETVRVRLSIPPGGELRLDSGLFTALLDGENVLYAQEGDWITLSDRLLRLLVESVSGGKLEGQLIYTERYL